MKTTKIQGREEYRKPVWKTFIILSVLALFTSCVKDEELFTVTEEEPFDNPKYTMAQTISEEAQRNTIAFDALGFMTGNLGAQTFLPPGKVADYSGFQYFRDNDPTGLGHNTDFVTLIAANMLDILTDDQIALYVSSAKSQIDQINAYAYKRFAICKAIRRLIGGELPVGTTGLSMEAVMNYSAELYRIDGEISYGRAELFGKVIGSMTSAQIAKMEALKKLNGVGNWPSTLTDRLKSMYLQPDVNVAVMTYASEMYTWYAGSVTADVYFCPERQGTYFGSFYLKDWPAMGNPNYTINEQLTGDAGQNFLGILTKEQSDMVTGLVSLQRNALTSLIDVRENISTDLRSFLKGSKASSTNVLNLSEEYGRYDGEIIYLYATCFSNVYNSLSDSQKSQLKALADKLGYVEPKGAFLYSTPIPMPTIENTDFLFK